MPNKNRRRLIIFAVSSNHSLIDADAPRYVALAQAARPRSGTGSVPPNTSSGRDATASPAAARS
jgi:hypothetical protein